MDNDKRLILAITLTFIVLFVYQAFFTPPAPQKKQNTDIASQQQADTSMPRRAAPALQEDIVAPASMLNTAIEPAPQTVTTTEDTSFEPVRVTTDLYSMIFSAGSTGIKSVQLHNYKEAIPPPAIINWINSLLGKNEQSLMQLDTTASKELLPKTSPGALPLQCAFISASGSVIGRNNWKSNKTEVLLHPGDSTGKLKFTRSDSTGLMLTKEFNFSAQTYKIKMTYRLANNSAETYDGSPFVEWTAHRNPKEGGGFFGAGMQTAPKFSYFINNAVEKKDLNDINERIVLEGNIAWSSIEEKYFTSAIIPVDTKPAQIRLQASASDQITYHLVYPRILLKPGQEAAYTCDLYLGPRDIDILKMQGAKLEKIIDFGWFDIIAKPLLLSLKFFYSYLGNYGLAIIVLTIIIKILFWPLTHKSFSSMKGMQAIQPEIAELKEKYKDNKEEFARQQMGLYKKYKVNPLGGCLPMLLQIPVFIALYRALMDSIELRHADFISFWINDLAAKDPTYIAPIVMGLSMVLQQKLTPTAVDPAQAKMMMMMPIVFTFMFLNFPAGLVIYWLVNNVLSIVQQLYINKK